MNFTDSGLKPTILRALEEMGYEQPTPIQQQTLTLFPEGKHILWQSQTWTGKTAAFVLPILNAVDPAMRDVQAVILVPTRELAMQTQEECYALGKYTRVKALAAYWGKSIWFQKKLLDQWMQIAVCTPWRAIDLIERWIMRVDMVQYLILDEVDRMLDMGFLDDVQWIWDQMPKVKQVMCFSATLPKPLIQLVDTRLWQNYEHITIQKEIIVDKIDHMFVDAPHISKRDMLDHWLKNHQGHKVIIFAQTKRLTRELRQYLQAQWYTAWELHGDIEQRDRTRTLKAYKENQIQILVATDVASRGLNMNDIDLVINYDVPQDPEDYVHRIWRTARAGKTWKAITFVADQEIKGIHAIEKLQKTRIKKVDAEGNELKRTDTQQSWRWWTRWRSRSGWGRPTWWSGQAWWQRSFAGPRSSAGRSFAGPRSTWWQRSFAWPSRWPRTEWPRSNDRWTRFSWPRNGSTTKPQYGKSRFGGVRS
jgi:ATP-dependent RNA helicase DeaD